MLDFRLDHGCQTPPLPSEKTADCPEVVFTIVITGGSFDVSPDVNNHCPSGDQSEGSPEASVSIISVSSVRISVKAFS